MIEWQTNNKEIKLIKYEIGPHLGINENTNAKVDAAPMPIANEKGSSLGSFNV